MSILDNLIADGAEAAVRAALTDYLNTQVEAGLLTENQAAYIEEGAVQAIALGLKEFQLNNPSKK